MGEHPKADIVYGYYFSEDDFYTFPDLERMVLWTDENWKEADTLKDDFGVALIPVGHYQYEEYVLGEEVAHIYHGDPYALDLEALSEMKEWDITRRCNLYLTYHDVEGKLLDQLKGPSIFVVPGYG